MREFPDAWQLSLAIIGAHFSFTKADLEELTAADLNFWLSCIGQYRVKQQQEARRK